MTTTTFDLGVAIHDTLMRDTPYETFALDSYGDMMPVAEFTVDDIDIGDADSPLVYVTNSDGSRSRFRISIVRID